MISRITAGGDVLSDMVEIFGALWVAFLVGLVIGWAWKPRWAGARGNKLGGLWAAKICDSPSSSSPSGSIFSPLEGSVSNSRSNSLKLEQTGYGSWQQEEVTAKEPAAEDANCRVSLIIKEEPFVMPEIELKRLYQLVESKDGGPIWIKTMDRSTPNMDYQAWQRDPEVGPPQYQTRTIIEDASPELVRDFFWEDEFRSKWDDTLVHSEIIEECPSTGSMVVQWTRKFPCFWSDREYIIGRRIWESEKSYYCVTKGVPYPSIKRCSKPKRVDLYYSSWCIRAVESRNGDGRPAASEVLLFHHEDTGILREIAKLGVHRGMWGAVMCVDPGLRAYHELCSSVAAPLSHHAVMARINTHVDPECLRAFAEADDLGGSEMAGSSVCHGGGSNTILPMILIVGGAVALACSLDYGLFTKALIFGMAKRFTKVGKLL